MVWSGYNTRDLVSRGRMEAGCLIGVDSKYIGIGRYVICTRCRGLVKMVGICEAAEVPVSLQQAVNG